MFDCSLNLQDIKSSDTRRYFYDMVGELVQVALTAGEFEAASTLLKLLESKANFQPTVYCKDDAWT